ncbi:sugar-specific transcriptional regulator TrmB [Methanomicrobium sp. W14]|uniref:TrmB family transcriptional regulator n=1 Tax=Methanomicrobium sp. W14 TaxID=2817839 RepID=UPI001AE43B5E|nr:helix-turn-helix domain-containing protein [Methanomicrobium sp. W14]MBP2134316.1 sugar-specific transcriptional regulator TrmB [Methanomicrobium sp. W14]
MIDNQPESGKISESLKSLGLTKYEALVYTALLQVDGATASEIHEISGVPRASVYPAIDKMVVKNIVSVSNTAPKRFSAAPPGEAVKNMLNSIKRDADEALDALNQLYESRRVHSAERQEYIWSITGEENISAKLREIVLSAEEEVFAICRSAVFRESVLSILKNFKGNVRIEVVTDRWEGAVPKNSSVLVFDEHKPQSQNAGNLSGAYIIDRKKALLIMDSKSGDKNINALYSESYGFVHFFMTYRSFICKHLKNLGDAKVFSQD